MYDSIHGNLVRQARAMALLLTLLEEEFSLRQARDSEAVMGLELSIHELMRQLAAERCEVRAMLDGGRVLDYAALLPEGQGDALRTVMAELDATEQRCARQASFNADLTLALLDQSQELLDYLHRRLVPPKPVAYGRRGTVAPQRVEAAIIHGRL